MNVTVAATYIVLSGLIVLLLALLLSDRKRENVEINDAMLNPEELEKHAAEIARGHVIGRGTGKSHWLMPRVNDNFRFISQAYKELNEDANNTVSTVPAAEWLLDNFYIVEEQAKDIRRSLSKGYYSKLPVLKSGYLKGYPRIYAIALELVAHTDGVVDEKSLVNFIRAYQSYSLLSIGELWAIAIMLRIAIIENVRNICDKVLESQRQWHKAEELADLILDNMEGGEDNLRRIMRENFKEGSSLNPSMVEHLLEKLRRQGKSSLQVVSHIDALLEEQNQSVDALVDLEHQLQAFRHVSIGNSISSLRLVSALDWNEIFETLSHVEHILRQDPSGTYTLMDFESRDYYRHEVEKLARAYRTSEVNVAKKAVECASEAGKGDGNRDVQNHVGYYLIGKERNCLRLKIGNKLYWHMSLGEALKRHPILVYIIPVIFFTLLITCGFVYYAVRNENGFSAALTLLTLLVVIIPASDLAVAAVNCIISHTFKPSILPKLKLEGGITREYSTMVIVPTLLPGEKRVRELLQQLEIYYLANRDKNLYFSLVGDFKDSDSRDLPEDESIARTAIEGICELNSRYASLENPVFFYFNRHRKYNDRQGKWMGWERKRGAIMEFNDLARGSRDTAYSITSCDVSKLPHVKYVITLDADTNLPMGAAKRLIGTIAHPMNKAVTDTEKNIVIDGYGILQPRIGINILSANNTLFSRIFAGQGGIDPYTVAVSDIYQDLFGEGIFTGKGIYELDVFQGVLKNAIPENTVLSHDLIEGCYLRAGLVTDIELVDGYPARYNSYAMRLHRWVRGDWQLLPWLKSQVRDREGRLVKNPLSLVSKWKIFDNLRRSLTNPALFILIVTSFWILPGSSIVWLCLALASTASPVFIHIMNSLLSDDYSSYSTRSRTTVISGMNAVLDQSGLLFAFIPYQAYLMADAIIKTLARVLFTRRNMLEWVTAADMELSLRNDVTSFWKRMWISPASGLLIFLLALMSSHANPAAALLIFIVWAAAPYIAYRVSIAYKHRVDTLKEEDLKLLRRLARKTWAYYEDFAGQEDNYLPPDNYQEEPPKGIAHRTSPTNIGFLLISILAARDLGFMGMLEMVERVKSTISSIERMEKWKGHLYNWYDTVSLHMLRPLYVSTVDSGNFIGYLMVLEQGLKEYLKRPMVDRPMAEGLMDLCYILNEEYCKEASIGTGSLEGLISDGCTGISGWYEALTVLKKQADEAELNDSPAAASWKSRLSGSIDALIKELGLFLPAVILSDTVPGFLEGNHDENPQACSGELIQRIKSLYAPHTPLELQLIYGELSVRLSALLEGRNDTESGNNAKEPFKNDISTVEYLKSLQSGIETARGKLADFIGSCETLCDRIRALIKGMEFAPLFDSKRQLFSIGFNVEEGHLGKSYYDLLASEARQASYIAIARGEVEQDHWFKLGRKLTLLDKAKGLVSWTGTMFEYLMPLLIMRNFENTLLDETYSFVVSNQKKYGLKRNVPWGVSESGYNAFDINLNYQYKAFGIPSLGLKRGLGNDIVIAPYATLLAVGIDPNAALSNIKRLQNEGLEGQYGFYEAVDYTPSRLMKDEKNSIVKSFMAHHQGMSLIAINNYLNFNIMQQRFHANPIIKSAELLLQERIPLKTAFTKDYHEEFIPVKKYGQEDGAVVRTFGIPRSLLPKVHMLSNGSYSIMITNGGSGYSRNQGMTVTRWRGDLKAAGSGMHIFIRNVNSNSTWSSTYEPFNMIPDRYRVVFSPDKAEFIRKDGNIETHTEIIVSPEDNAELRRVSLTNYSEGIRIVETTSYLEVVLANADEDLAHPAFSNLFIRTEFIPEYNCLLASRRPRSEKQKPSWAVHSLLTDCETIGDLQYETDRSKFIGRNRSLRDPFSMEVDRPLSNTAGAVIDPVMSIRRRVKILPGQTVKMVYVTAVADTRRDALELAEKFTDGKSMERAFELAWTRSQIETRYLGFKSKEVEQYLETIPAILFPNSLRRSWAETITGNTKGQPDLWPFGISGDIPIVLVSIAGIDELNLVYWALKAHEYWRMKGLTVDLLLMLEDESSYTQPLFDAVRDAVSASHARELIDRSGGVFIRNSRQIGEAEKNLLYTAARIIFKGSIEATIEQIDSAEGYPTQTELLTCLVEGGKPAALTRRTGKLQPSEGNGLEFFNGVGGFGCNGTEYVINLREGQHTPAPWINVIANRKFGFLVSESGGGYTWAENSRENKLTPWYNDPVSDPPGEVFYLRDEEKGNYWSLTPSPANGGGEYVIRHGQGYSSFEHDSCCLEQKLTMFVPVEGQVKISIVKLKNTSGKIRNLTVTYYIRPVMGVNEKVTSPYISVQLDKESGMLLARNHFSTDFAGRILFVHTSENEYSHTGDRMDFMGINGSLEEPEAMNRENLSGNTGAGADPCVAVRIKIRLEADEEKEVVFLLGQSSSMEEASGIASRFGNPPEAKLELERIRSFWREKLGTVQVSTPDRSMDLILNSWLLYQVTVCRLWARSAYYQSGGAFGFRDQLQDVMALVYTWPELVRSQILLHASRQFVEGDVQHWWHPEAGKGIRTKYSDDLLWLPYVTADYIECTNDWDILDEEISYLEGKPLAEDEDERYDIPSISGECSSLYEHCIRALELSLRFGEHGIPLMGSGDWNDGMNNVGNKGRGESVWLGWFLFTVLKRFIPICSRRRDEERAQRYSDTACEIIEAIEREAWDGSWYRRAYFDDGTPLGSIQNTECRIDSISQSWAAISGAGKPNRVEEAMGAVEKYLVDRDEGIIKLLEPPFDQGDLKPGYIKGYVPGVRENGGQYTHAAAWVALAFAKMGKGRNAWELFHMINPVNHSRTSIEYSRYKVEPYVVAADVYAIRTNNGRGGWTWYTGAAGWLYRVGIEHILGLKVTGSAIYIDPCIPEQWEEYKITYVMGRTTYDITVLNPDGVSKGVKKVETDNAVSEDGAVRLNDDGGTHVIKVTMG